MPRCSVAFAAFVLALASRVGATPLVVAPPSPTHPATRNLTRVIDAAQTPDAPRSASIALPGARPIAPNAHDGPVAVGPSQPPASPAALTNTSFTFTLPGSAARVGASVAVAGDVNGDGYSDLIVGAPNYSNGQSQEGEALLFLGGPNGYASTPSWSYESNVAGANLGYSVAPAGDVNGDGYADVIVGAPNYTNGPMTNAGRVYVFLGGPSGLSSTPAWTFDGPQAHELCGWSVCTAGDVNGDGYDDVIEGSPGYSDITIAQEGQRPTTAPGAPGVGPDGPTQVTAVFNNGRARVFYGGSSGLSTSPAWEKSGFQYASAFGFSVSTANDVNGDGYDDVVIAAPYSTNLYTSVSNAGEFDVFQGGSSGLPLTASTVGYGGGTGELRGYCVAGVGDINGDGYADVAVGSPGYSDVATNQGAVIVFAGSSLGVDLDWIFLDEGPVANPTYPGGQFGTSVAPAGDVNGDGYADFVVGAPYYTISAPNAIYVGYVAVYEGTPVDGGTPNTGFARLVFATTDGHGSEMGYSVCAAGDEDGDGFGDVVVGAPTAGASDGRVTLFRGAGDMPQLSGTRQVIGVDTEFGVGDLNGDGFDDLAGATDADPQSPDINIYLGAPSGAPTTPSQTLSSVAVDGDDVAILALPVGDVNGDGFDDLSVTTYSTLSGLTREVIFPGGASGVGTTPIWSLPPSAGYAEEDGALPAGDVNGDGYADFFVASAESIRVFLGDPSGPSTTPASTFPGDRAAAVGDVNGDGFDDLSISETGYTGSHVKQGRARVFPGSVSGLGSSSIQTVLGQAANARLYCAGRAGDVNGDGLADFLCHDGPDIEVVYGSDALSATILVLPATAIACAPIQASDLDDDGYTDVVVTGFIPLGGTDSLDLWVYRGGSAGLASTPSWNIAYLGFNGILAFPGQISGDYNGDGFPDIVWNHGTTLAVDPWESEIVYGNGQWTGAPGLDRDAFQLRDADSGPISVIGNSDQPDRFRLHSRGRSAVGRTSVRMQSETSAWGQDFSGASLQSTAWQALPVPGVDGSFFDHFDQEWTNLSPGTRYKWRTRITAHSPYFPWTPWLTPARNSRQEADLRTPATVSGVTDRVPASLEFLAPAPNPMRDGTTLRFALPSRATVRLEVFDLGGRRVATLADGTMEAGAHAVRWDARGADGSQVGDGVYFARLVTSGRTLTQRLVVLR
jgi:FG-GAP repeat/FG-GAP-like repeat/FlgD Ig-like domain